MKIPLTKCSQFIAYNKDIQYCLARRPGSSDYYILAQDRVEYLSKIIVQQLEVLETLEGKTLYMLDSS